MSDFWTALGSIGTLAAVVVALFPLLKEATILRKKNLITRFSILSEIDNIHESYYGKIYDNAKRNANAQSYTIPPHDYDFFRNLETLLSETIHLKSKERVAILEIISIFKKCQYRKFENGVHIISITDIKKIESVSNQLLIALNISMTNDREKDEKKLPNFRDLAYQRITEVFMDKEPTRVTSKEDVNRLLVDQSRQR